MTLSGVSFSQTSYSQSQLCILCTLATSSSCCNSRSLTVGSLPHLDTRDPELLDLSGNLLHFIYSPFAGQTSSPLKHNSAGRAAVTNGFHTLLSHVLWLLRKWLPESESLAVPWLFTTHARHCLTEQSPHLPGVTGASSVCQKVRTLDIFQGKVSRRLVAGRGIR